MPQYRVRFDVKRDRGGTVASSATIEASSGGTAADIVRAQYGSRLAGIRNWELVNDENDDGVVVPSAGLEGIFGVVALFAGVIGVICAVAVVAQRVVNGVFH
jgi:hypothetical protein